LIRTLTEHDAAEYRKLRSEALETEPFAFGKDPTEFQTVSVEAIAQRLRDSSQNNFTVGAFEEGKLVGIATFVRETNLKEKHKGHIYGVMWPPIAGARTWGKTSSPRF
jgi:predicted N-acetyltransferase YhbS